AADAWGAALIVKLERDPRALGAILTRIAGTPGPTAKILLSHPEARERAAAIETIARAAAVPPTLSGGTSGAAPAGLLSACEWAGAARAGRLPASEWAAVRRLCQAAPQAEPRSTPQAPRAMPQPPPSRSDRRGALPQPEPRGR